MIAELASECARTPYQQVNEHHFVVFWYEKGLELTPSTSYSWLR